jgi:hypothetical protein
MPEEHIIFKSGSNLSGFTNFPTSYNVRENGYVVSVLCSTNGTQILSTRSNIKTTKSPLQRNFDISLFCTDLRDSLQRKPNDGFSSITKQV